MVTNSFIKGRNTHITIARLSSWVRSSQSGITCLLDFEKAYNNVSHEWLNWVMNTMGLE